MRPVGSVVRLSATWWEGSAPVEGDILRTRTGRCYLIDAVRHISGDRYALTCTVLGQDAAPFGEGVHLWSWNRREKSSRSRA